MSRIDVLVEFVGEQENGFAAFETTAAAAPRERVARAERLGAGLSGLGVEFTDTEPAVPMFSGDLVSGRVLDDRGFAAFGDARANPDVPASSTVVTAIADSERLEVLAARPNVRVWPNSRLTLYPAPSDCPPFSAAVPIDTVREALGIDAMRVAGGGTGQGIAVAILDEGFDGARYAAGGGFALPGTQQPGTAPVTSHGSMCAAGVLVAAPDATLFDYPFLGIPSSGGALRMFQAVLDARRQTGRPHVATNSYGFVEVPARTRAPNHEIWDLNHPLHRKIREVVASGITVLFAAGNCGRPCPSRDCHGSGTGPGRSIHGSNSLADVITVAAVNTSGRRIGYSSQGPGMFEARKPDVVSFSHFFGNFGPGRPAGTHVRPFDGGTSAATPVAAGVVAALLSAAPALTPNMLKRVLIDSTGNARWNADAGYGIVRAERAWHAVQAMLT